MKTLKLISLKNQRGREKVNISSCISYKSDVRKHASVFQRIPYIISFKNMHLSMLHTVPCFL